MKKSTLLKKTKNELVDKLISLEDNYDSLEINYRDICDKYASCIAENEECINTLSHNTKRHLIISFVVCVILLILNVIQLFV